MICIKKITDNDFNLKNMPLDNPRVRYGARGIVLNSDGKIAILCKKNKNEYKLIGGGVEEDEEPNNAFLREVLEESGCIVKIDKCIGTIEEIKSQDNFKQISYVFVSHVIEDTGRTHYTQKEKDEGAELLWVDLDDAINLIKNCESKLVASKYESVYHTKFIVRRDYEILKYYQSVILN